MEWLRDRLRRWLFPEIAEKRSDIRNIKKGMSEIADQLEDLRDETIKMVEHRIDGAERGLSDERRRAELEIRFLRNEALAQISGEMGAMFYTFSGKKRVAVKDVLRMLLDRQRLTIHLVKGEKGELNPVIRKKRYKEVI